MALDLNDREFITGEIHEIRKEQKADTAELHRRISDLSGDFIAFSNSPCKDVKALEDKYDLHSRRSTDTGMGRLNTFAGWVVAVISLIGLVLALTAGK